MSEVRVEFEVGDLVMVKSGSPTMTVDRLVSGRVECLWFDGMEPRRFTFDPKVICNVIEASDASDTAKAKVEIRPRADQVAFLESQHSGVTVCRGGCGSGKTTIGIEKSARFIRGRRPALPFLFVAADEAAAESLTMRLNDGHGDLSGLSRVVVAKEWGGRGISALISTIEPISGFMIDEQVSWDVMKILMRRCENYEWIGNKLLVLTPAVVSRPLDLNSTLQAIEEYGVSQYESWGFYQMSTVKAYEAGHVNAKWYAEFCSLIADKEKPTRLYGEYPK